MGGPVLSLLKRSNHVVGRESCIYIYIYLCEQPAGVVVNVPAHGNRRVDALRGSIPSVSLFAGGDGVPGYGKQLGCVIDPGTGFLLPTSQLITLLP